MDMLCLDHVSSKCVDCFWDIDCAKCEESKGTCNDCLIKNHCKDYGKFNQSNNVLTSVKNEDVYLFNRRNKIY